MELKNRGKESREVEHKPKNEITKNRGRAQNPENPRKFFFLEISIPGKKRKPMQPYNHI